MLNAQAPSDPIIAQRPRSDAFRLAALLAVVMIPRILAAAGLPLVTGEAYYWLWGRHLAAGYYDHPPMVAVMSALCFGWVDQSELAARASALILGALSSIAVYLAARALFPAGPTALRAAMLYTITPLFHINGIFLGPDNGLLLFMPLTWALFWRAAEGVRDSAGYEPGAGPATMNTTVAELGLRVPGKRLERGRGSPKGGGDSEPRGDGRGLGLWAATGVAAGLALLSKFHAWILLPPLWAFLILSRRHRPLLRTAGPWLAALVAWVVLSPNLVWNARHEWINYAFQWHRSNIPEAQLKLEHILAFLLPPLGTLGPLLYGGIFWGVWRGWRRWRVDDDPRYLYLLLAGLPLPVFLGILSPVVPISPHWPGAGFVPLLILVVGLWGEMGAKGGRIFRAAAISAAILIASAHLAIAAAPHIMSKPEILPGGMFDLDHTKRKYFGWEELGRRCRAELKHMEAGGPAFLMAESWHPAGMIAFYSDRTRDVFAYDEGGAHNFDVWRRERGGLGGQNAVVVIEKGNPNYPHKNMEVKYDKFLRLLSPLFDKVEPVGSLAVYPDGSTAEYWGAKPERPLLREFLFFRCRGFKGRLAED